jgi:hypothetical protein
MTQEATTKVRGIFPDPCHACGSEEVYIQGDGETFHCECEQCHERGYPQPTMMMALGIWNVIKFRKIVGIDT